MMHGHEKSDRRVVLTRASNNAAPAAAEKMEGRRLLKGSVEWRDVCWTQRQHSHVQYATRPQVVVRQIRSERYHAITQERSPVRESRTPGSVRGAASNRRPYRD